MYVFTIDHFSLLSNTMQFTTPSILNHYFFVPKIEDYNDEELLTIIGLFEMYGFPLGPSGAKAFHLGPCFMKSSCKPNSYSIILSDNSIMYKASVKIGKGQPITRCYGDVTRSTYFR